MLRLAIPDVQRAFRSGYDETMLARNGQRIEQMLPVLKNALRHGRPVDAVIEKLGTNDVFNFGSTHGR